MALPSSTIVMLLLFFMVPIILGLTSNYDSSLPFMEHCAIKNTATYYTLGEYSKVLESSSEEGVVESSEKRMTSCGRMVYDTELGECINSEIAETTEERMRLDVSDVRGSFAAELWVPIIIFMVLIYFGTSFFVYVVIALIIFMILFAFFTNY